MAYWLAIGPPDNWSFCFENGNVWGFAPRHKKLWQALAEGDSVLCYATRPVAGVIGHCTVGSKQEAKHRFFPQESVAKKVLWPLRVTLASGRIIQQEQWTTSRILLEPRSITFQQSLQRLPEERARRIIKDLEGV